MAGARIGRMSEIDADFRLACGSFRSGRCHLIGAASIGVENDQDCFHPMRIQPQKSDRGKASNAALAHAASEYAKRCCHFERREKFFFADFIYSKESRQTLLPSRWSR